MKTAFIVLACLCLVLEVKGQSGAPKGRCFCAGKGVNMVLPRKIEKVEIIPPSPSCEKQEIVVTVKNGSEQKCLNPESKFTQNYIRKLLEKRIQ
ncbi:C-X-C motif chemokine 11-6-like [Triplophysa rosa]|uniref:CXC chemokine n=1 Tax=Triplophysa rosa TaxID=992332 RepID=A0A9W8CAV1_TRIRA|nr:C-X-C motif chemokine 11-6-like [Triplophysa rosa]KAI7812997.1 CXC chemokine [Triplophysa rosa]